MQNQTQTTENGSSQARVRGYYYGKLLLTGCGSFIPHFSLERTILLQEQKSGNPTTLPPHKERHFHPNPLEGDGNSKAVLVKPYSGIDVILTKTA